MCCCLQSYWAPLASYAGHGLNPMTVHKTKRRPIPDGQKPQVQVHIVCQNKPPCQSETRLPPSCCCHAGAMPTADGSSISLEALASHSGAASGIAAIVVSVSAHHLTENHSAALVTNRPVALAGDAHEATLAHTPVLQIILQLLIHAPDSKQTVLRRPGFRLLTQDQILKRFQCQRVSDRHSHPRHSVPTIVGRRQVRQPSH